MAEINKSYTTIKGTMGQELRSKRIGLCITGSVAIIKIPEIARELLRHGAEVIPVMSNDAQKLIQPELIRWASQNEVVTSITGLMEHIRLTEDGPEKLDLILIAPATANTISKLANGVSDTTVTLIASCAQGSGIPILAAPSMHKSLWCNPAVATNVDKLKNIGVDFLEPIIKEERAKIVQTKDIVEAVINRLYLKDMAGIKVFVTAGPTHEKLDPIRILTNQSSGKMGFALANEALRRGADVTLVSGSTFMNPPCSVEFIQVETTQQMYDSVVAQLKEEKFDLFLAAAAPEDFRPVTFSETKMSSRISRSFDVKFSVTEKVIDIVKKIQPTIFLVAFKAEWNLSRDKLIECARVVMHEAQADMVAANDSANKEAGFNSNSNEIVLLKKDNSIIDIPLAPKQVVAKKILDAFIEDMRIHSK